jgi:hypothetical protein
VTAGKSILEMLWESLDAAYERLVADDIGGPPDDGWPDEWREYGEQRGRCQGLAEAIAVLTNPYAPDLPAVKTEVKRRHDNG